MTGAAAKTAPSEKASDTHLITALPFDLLRHLPLHRLLHADSSVSASLQVLNLFLFLSLRGRQGRERKRVYTHTDFDRSTLLPSSMNRCNYSLCLDDARIDTYTHSVVFSRDIGVKFSQSWLESSSVALRCPFVYLNP